VPAAHGCQEVGFHFRHFIDIHSVEAYTHAEAVPNSSTIANLQPLTCGRRIYGH
jgi:hypothetical protein